MGDNHTTISPQDLISRVGTRDCPIIFDVRRAEVFAEAPDLLPTAKWRDHLRAQDWGAALPPDRDIVVYCVHGHNVSHGAAALLRAAGRRVRTLDGGIEGYRDAGGLVLRKDAIPKRAEATSSRWITRERPKIDRIACPWFIRRFIDREAEIHYVPAEWVSDIADEFDAVAFDIPDVLFSHVGEKCSFDAFLDHSGISDPALQRLATIIRGADTGRLDLAPEAAGLLAASLGLSATWRDDLAMMDQSFVLYDALLGWCRHAADESHGWPPAPTKMAV